MDTFTVTLDQDSDSTEGLTTMTLREARQVMDLIPKGRARILAVGHPAGCGCAYHPRLSA